MRHEIDGFIADRLLEALWREALWLVHDGVATVEEIDDAVRYGAGLRWAFMGTFLTYRIAGGERGMRHFLSQFGPALQLPWTKLIDVPELTHELIETLVAPVGRAGERSDRSHELERRRDDCLVADAAGAARRAGAGAGETVGRWERRLLAAQSQRASRRARGARCAARRSTASRCRPGWIDYNGHIPRATTSSMFGDATDAVLRLIGVDDEYVESTGELLHRSRRTSLISARRSPATALTVDDAGARVTTASACTCSTVCSASVTAPSSQPLSR